MRRSSLLALLTALVCAQGCSSQPPPTETPPGSEVCDNFNDDNGDGKADCLDPLCFDHQACSPATETCTNDLDDDGDSLIDCGDPDCQSDPACWTSEVCTGGVDEDADGKTDCFDPDCAASTDCGPKEQCNNNKEDNGDLLIDCDDPTCANSPNCPSSETGNCQNGTDEDNDGAVDCADADCLAECPSSEDSAAECQNGQDDDGDFLIDCADASCLATTPCQNPPESNCADAVDNDADGQTDCADPDCVLAPSCQTTGENCQNGADDDGDQQIDCADPDCASKVCGAGCVCKGGAQSEANCADLADNDGDGQTDCKDADCVGNASCPGAETSCGDGADNDSDGSTDCADPDCNAQSCGSGCACSMQAKTETVCNDSTDNDADGSIDCSDSDCAGSPQCPLVDDGQPCTANSQCKGGLCLTEVASGYPGGHCTNAAACTVGTTNGCNGGVCTQAGNTTRCRIPCAGASGCRPGYECFDPDASTSTANSICLPLCSADSQCTATGQGATYGCNPWSKFCEQKDKGKTKYGGPCTLHSDCESAWCDTSRPGGYCLGVCDGTTKSCGGDGHCLMPSSPTDNVGTCYDGCTSDSSCRPSTYACLQAGSLDVCWCLGPNSFCGQNRDCCSGVCDFFGFCF